MLASEQRYLAEIILTQLTIKVPNFGPKNSNFACKSQIFRISFQKMLRSLGLGLGLETFAKFLRVSVSVSKNLVSEKSLGFGFGKFGLKVTELFTLDSMFVRSSVRSKQAIFRQTSLNYCTGTCGKWY